ncbi:hypothetical protein [Nonomuraea sp. NPDC052265]|uniref:hypothetical protein n=1 Tax=Nonomuraea sp. NPDC052265 TaxID=3364374 RepID=UPI0037C9AFDE
MTLHLHTCLWHADSAETRHSALPRGKDPVMSPTHTDTPAFAADRYQIEVTPLGEPLTYRVALLDAGTGKTLTALTGVTDADLPVAVHRVIAQQDARGPIDCPVAIAARAALMLIDLDAALQSDGTFNGDYSSLFAHLSRGTACLASSCSRVAAATDHIGHDLRSHPWGVTADRAGNAHRQLASASGYLETASEQALQGQAEFASGRP